MTDVLGVTAPEETKERKMAQGFSSAAMFAAMNGDLESFIAAATPDGIERQEAAGQRSFVASETLPKKMHGCTREKMEQMGVVFGADADDLFVRVQLPEGWKKQATENSMWSDLLDGKGRKRASIFYKAAFYDRIAHISLCQRYSVNGYEPCDSEGTPAEYGKNSHMQTVVRDGNTIIHVAGICEELDYKTGEAHVKEARDWLTTHFPDWHNPLAYWE